MIPQSPIQDQHLAGVRDFAQTIARFRSSLIESGVPEHEAANLTSTYLIGLLSKLTNPQ